MSAIKQESFTQVGNENIKPLNNDIDFHGAAFIDQNGQEVAITDEMIKEACSKFINNTASHTH